MESPQQPRKEGLQVDRYQLFYVEAIMHDSSFPNINSIKPIFDRMTIDEFIQVIERITTSGDYELTQQFLYFLLLFRDMKHIQEYLNSDRLGLDLLEKFIIFTFGYCSLHNHSTERIIDEILYFLDRDRLFNLTISSKFIYRDKLLLFLILTKFDIDMLNRYFASVKNVAGFIVDFLKLPDEVLRSIIARNYHLFQYLMIMMTEADTEQKGSADFFSRYQDEIHQFSRMHDLLRKYKSRTDFEKEKDLPFGMRDMSRISFMVNMIRELPDPARAIAYFDGENVFMDEFEKKVVYAIVTDPLLKNTFSHYNGMSPA